MFEIEIFQNSLFTIMMVTKIVNILKLYTSNLIRIGFLVCDLNLNSRIYIPYGITNSNQNTSHEITLYNITS